MKKGTRKTCSLLPAFRIPENAVLLGMANCTCLFDMPQNGSRAHGTRPTPFSVWIQLRCQSGKKYISGKKVKKTIDIYNPFSTLEMINKAGIPWKIRKFRLFLWLKMLYILSNSKIFLSFGLSPLAYSGVCPMAVWSAGSARPGLCFLYIAPYSQYHVCL